ncbi:hypothetical protein KIPB_009952 [Kipferlia bialata]|uniref:Uncharacterized protein n=1 Tax=Kipferlia bialata TaxID=797122 RepID=A0A9K3D4P4_9EUKA|nr:hypothetical protein KIPB_009952 [Kipferlia bialata]|eukprot:g9952.t1
MEEGFELHSAGQLLKAVAKFEAALKGLEGLDAETDPGLKGHDYMNRAMLHSQAATCFQDMHEREAGEGDMHNLEYDMAEVVFATNRGLECLDKMKTFVPIAIIPQESRDTFHSCKAGLLFKQGVAMASLDNFDRALELFNESEALSPSDATRQMIKGCTMMQKIRREQGTTSSTI